MVKISSIGLYFRLLTACLSVAVALLYSGNLKAQLIQKDTVWQVHADTVSVSLWLGGYSDAENTKTEGTIHNYFSIGFQPMRYIRILNEDTVPVQTPHILMNQRKNFYTRASAASEALASAQTAKEKAFSMFDFVRRNRVHLDPAEHSHLGETHDPIKVLSVYGYGICDDAANTLKRLSQEAGYPSLEWGVTAHSLPEADFGTGMALLDPDIEVFYPDYDLHKWIGKNDAVRDRYLVSRVHHYGRNQPFNTSFSRHIASMFVSFANLDNRITDPFEIKYKLRPGQQLQLNWDSAMLEHRIYGIATPTPARRHVIANAEWTHTLQPNNAGFHYQIDASSNLKINTNGVLPVFSPNSPQNCADIAWKIDYSFPQLDHRLYMLLNLPDSDSVQVEWSADSVTWQTVAQFQGPYSGWDSCNAYALIAPLMQPALYKSFLRIRIYQADLNLPAGIDSISLLSITQMSKNFMPDLTIGTNELRFSHADTGILRHIRMEIAWAEEHQNRPPQVNPTPVYPGVGLQTDTALILFRWGHAWDPDGDAIAEYHFRLSDRPDMAYPIAPNYDRYISPTGTLIPAFQPEVAGFLQHGQTYYWQVRARDAKGLWGDWGPVWNFTPKSVMQPLVTGFQLLDTAMVIFFQPAQTGKSPASYELHGSNEMYGFTPEVSTLVGVTQQPFYNVPTSAHQPPKTFYRIIAIDSFGQKSAPSITFEAPFPFVYTRQSYSMFPDSAFHLELKGNRRTFAWFHYFYPDTLHYDAWVSPVSYPPFLSWDVQNSVFSGMIDSVQARFMLFDTTLNQIRFQVLAPQTQPIFQTVHIEPGVQNLRPQPTSISQTPVMGQPYQDTIRLLDGDALFGDTHTWQVIQGPAWLQLLAANDTLILYGTPGYAALYDTIWEISVTDSRGLSDTITLHFAYAYQNAPPQILSQPDTMAYALQWYQSVLTISDPDSALGDNFQVILVQSPNWLTYNAQTSTLQGFTNTLSSQQYQVKIWVQDMHGATAVQEFTLYVKQMVGIDSTDMDSILSEIILDGPMPGEVSGVFVFPNPVNMPGKIQLHLAENAEIQLSIYTTDGKHIRTILEGFREAGVRQMNLNTDGLSAGTYLLRLMVINEFGVAKYQTTRLFIP
jgi:hypothetical protein